MAAWTHSSVQPTEMFITATLDCSLESECDLVPPRKVFVSPELLGSGVSERPFNADQRGVICSICSDLLLIPNLLLLVCLLFKSHILTHVLLLCEYIQFSDLLSM